jgi:hypothetical protein
VDICRGYDINALSDQPAFEAIKSLYEALAVNYPGEQE